MTNLREIFAKCPNRGGLWRRVFAPEYSRHIWCELAVIVGFSGTTVCLVSEEQGGLDGKEMFKRFLEFLRLSFHC